MELRQVRNDLPEGGQGRGSMSYFDKLRSGLEVSPPPPPPCCSSSTEYVEQRGRMRCRGIGLPRFMLAYATFLLTMFNLYGLELPSQQPAWNTVSAGRAADDPDLCPDLGQEISVEDLSSSWFLS